MFNFTYKPNAIFFPMYNINTNLMFVYSAVLSENRVTPVNKIVIISTIKKKYTSNETYCFKNNTFITAQNIK